ncbi:hypothetical protein AAFP35_01380 [Gordonia sp. CPCC 206044]|uniref:hypothetical protein n=1 Tax=Gordonia sp. CPCC 206044 TaxID=3140793 RepID=UPI003AF3B948
MTPTYGSTGTDTAAGYDDTATGPIGAPAYSEAAPDGDTAVDGAGVDGAGGEGAPAEGAGSASGGSGVNWPTVLVSGGVAAIISAVIVTIGVVGLLVSELGDRDAAASAQQQPTVVNLGSAQSAAPSAAAPGAGAAPGAPGAPAAAAPPAAAAAPPEGSSADLPAGGGTSGGGMLPGAAAPQGVPQAQSAAPQQTTARSTPTVGKLQNDLDMLVGGGSPAQKAARLEGGSRAVTQAQPIVTVLQRFKPLGFSYRVTGPVSVNGGTAKATLELRSPGWNPAKMPLYWVWKGGQWKLSNRSICDIGSYAQIPCSL